MIGSSGWLLLTAELVALTATAPRLWRASRGGRQLLSQSAASSDEAAWISVVIPARNESRRIAECIAPLIGARGIREVIVVDDQSSDDTATIARNLGATVVSGAPLPEGWVGKIWALHQGIQVAVGEVIVTLDADARPDPSLPFVAATAFAESGAKLATVAPRFRVTSVAGRWLHAAMLTSLVYRYGAGSGTASHDSVANGQCMVFRRDDAVREEWCVAVKSHIIEDVALLRHLVRNGAHVEMFDGSRLLAVQMFEGFTETLRGWGRSLPLSDVDRPLRQWVRLLTTALTLVAPLWLVVFGMATPVSYVLLAVRLGVLFGTRRAYEQGGVGYWLSPIADLFVWVVVAKGTLSPSREWRGRKY